MPEALELLIWTENYWIGGCDRFLADLVAGLRGRPVTVTLAGNEHPAFDAWLSARVPEVLPRERLRIANPVHSPLQALESRWRARRLGASGVAAVSEPAAPVPLSAGPRDIAVAAVRYSHAARNLPRLRALMRRRRPDVLLINNGGYPGGESCSLAALAAQAAGVPRVLYFVHNMAGPPAWPQRAERRLDRRVDAATDVWMTAAHRASDALAARRAITRERILTLHYGIDPPAAARGRDALRAELGFRADALSVLAVANFEPRKGLAVLIDALAALHEQGVAVQTAIVGDGPLRGALRDQVRRHGLGEHVHFTGWREDVDALMDAADALVLPSLGHECLPYVILEAMGHRLPVISTDVAGIPEMVEDGVTGYVLTPADVTALTEALRGLSALPDRGRALGERGYERVRERFTLTAMVDRMAGLIGID